LEASHEPSFPWVKGNKKVSSDSAHTLLHQGIAAAKQGRWAAARPLLHEVTEIDPENVLGWLWLAAATKSDQEAIAHLERVLEINPKNHRALAGIAQIRGRSSKSPTASKASEARPSSNMKCLFCFGELRIHVSQCSACGAILTLTDPDAFLNNQEIDHDHLLEAIARLEKSNASDPDYETNYALGLAYLNTLRLEKALTHLQTALRLKPEDKDLQTHLEILFQLKSPFGHAAKAKVRRGKILIVDDSPTVRKLVAMTLERCGHDVIAAKDGMEAMARINDGIPDLILLDISMPRMDGYQLCKTIKGNQSTNRIPVVMLTGKDGLLDKMRGRMVGSDDYLTKPFEPDVLVDLVERHVGSVAAR
jgi:twitching motility two-component system response regulator PilG